MENAGASGSSVGDSVHGTFPSASVLRINTQHDIRGYCAVGVFR